MQKVITLKFLIKKNPIIKLKASELSIKNLFNELLNELKGLEYQITLAILLNKMKTNGELEYSPVYFNSTTKTVSMMIMG